MSNEHREHNLPTAVVDEHQQHRRAVVMETAYILDELRDMGADELAERFRVARMTWLSDLDDKLAITDIAHTAREMFAQTSKAHTDLVRALETGDFTHGQLADFLEVYGPELQTEWETDDAERLAAQWGVSPAVVFTLLAAVRGDAKALTGKHAYEAAAILGNIARALHERAKSSA